MSTLAYAIVTPARNEVENLDRLSASLVRQDVPPSRWVIVDNGSTDGTGDLARRLARGLDWVVVTDAPSPPELARGGPVVRAFHVGLHELELVGPLPDVVVKVDADVSFQPDYFRRLMRGFELDPSLGIASGSAWERDGTRWAQQHMTGDSVWGAARAYRRECLPGVLPLEERMGWDGIDAYKAQLAGWKTRTFPDLAFFHHRQEGERDGARRRAWAAQGRASHYMGYRFPYLVARALHNARSEPAALAMVQGYLGAAVRREPRCQDTAVREALRREQQLRRLPNRALEVVSRR